jgi:major membrane immunogen (membrane-anchored lipoprotein)
MKRSAIFFVAFTLAFLSCGDPEPTKTRSTTVYEDGVYRVVYDAFDNRGWKPEMEIQVRGGVVVSATYDYVNPAGEFKSQDAGYAERMKERSGTTPIDASNALVSQMVDLNSADVDIVTGATHSSETFRVMGAAGLEKAVSGDSEITVLFMNQTYTAEDEADDRGYSASIAVTFEDGLITKVEYSEKNDAGSKWDDEAYNTRMKESSGVSWSEAATSLQDTLVASQNIFGLDTITGATGLSERFSELAKAALTKR